MGEAKNKRRHMTDEEIIAQALTRELANQGKLVEAGWVGFKLMVVPKDAPDVQVEEMRLAFMAGAHHVFFSFITMLDESPDETPGDLHKVDLLQKELLAIGEDLKLRGTPEKGRA